MTTVCTVGHSNRSLDEFVELLHAHGIRQLVDVRTVPKSRSNPHFAGDALAPALAAEGISYDWVRELGGLRKPLKDSPNGAWRNDSFRGYADHMQTDEFARAVDDLVRRARDGNVVIMCAEAVPWRCHRSLVGDALVARGVDVVHLMSPTSARPHTLRDFAEVDGTRVWYPRGPDDASD